MKAQMFSDNQPWRTLQRWDFIRLCAMQHQLPANEYPILDQGQTDSKAFALTIRIRVSVISFSFANLGGPEARGRALIAARQRMNNSRSGFHT